MLPSIRHQQHGQILHMLGDQEHSSDLSTARCVSGRGGWGHKKHEARESWLQWRAIRRQMDRNSGFIHSTLLDPSVVEKSRMLTQLHFLKHTQQNISVTKQLQVLLLPFQTCPRAAQKRKVKISNQQKWDLLWWILQSRIWHCTSQSSLKPALKTVMCFRSRVKWWFGEEIKWEHCQRHERWRHYTKWLQLLQPSSPAGWLMTNHHILLHFWLKLSCLAQRSGHTGQLRHRYIVYTCKNGNLCCSEPPVTCNHHTKSKKQIWIMETCFF